MKTKQQQHLLDKIGEQLGAIKGESIRQSDRLNYFPLDESRLNELREFALAAKTQADAVIDLTEQLRAEIGKEVAQ